MASVSIDTYKVVSILQERGYSKQQAEGFVAVLQNADLIDVATQGDVTAIKDALITLDRSIQAARVETYKVAAAQTVLLIGALVALVQVL